MGADTSIKWKEINTEHFDVIFDAQHTELAKKYAFYAELAYLNLKSVYSELPRKTVLVMSDSTDVANAFATFLPYPTMIAYPVLPVGGSSVDHYDNWIYKIILHEYAHILTFYPANSFYKPLGYIFGQVISPNALLPLWMQEGLAVNVETRLTQHGRLRSPLYSAQLRALVQDDKLYDESIDRINEGSIPSWPYGQRPYLFGALLWNEILNDRDLKLSDELLQSYSRRLPFLITEPLKKKLNQSYQLALDKAYEEISRKSLGQIEEIRLNQKYKEKRVLSSSTSESFVAISPDGQHMASVSYRMYDGAYLELRSRESQEMSFEGVDSQKLISLKQGTKAAWLPNSEEIVYDQVQTYRKRYSYRDLFLYNLKSKKSKRLTRGARAHHPSALDNENIVFAAHEPNKTTIKIFNLKTEKISDLINPASGVRLEHPTPYGKEGLLFIAKNSSGKSQIYLYNQKTKKRLRIFSDHEHVTFLKAHGNRIYFIDAQNNIPNVYVANNIKEAPVAVTHSTTLISSAEWDASQNHLYFNQLTSEGPKLFMLDQISAHTLARYPTVYKSHGFDQKPLSDPERRQEAKLLSDKKIESYKPISYMLPRYWIPFLYPVENGVLIQGSTTMSDPVGHHQILLNVSYDTVTKKISHGVSYTNSSTDVEASISHIKSHSYLAASETVVSDQLTGGSIAFYLPFMSEKWTSSFGWNNIVTERLTQDLTRDGPNASLRFNNLNDEALMGGQYTLSHSSYLKSKDQIGYDKTILAFNSIYKKLFPVRHRLVSQLKVAYAPELENKHLIALGDKTSNGNYLASLMTSQFMMRGYPSAEFIGRNTINLNLEYKFPILDIYKGRSLLPAFFKTLSGNVFIDGIALDGAYHDAVISTYRATSTKETFWSTGFEFSLSTTVGWQLPLDILLGAHYGFDEKANGGQVVPFLGIGLSGFTGVSEKPSRH